ncbi:phage tail tape measure protein [Haemophilus influenzae]|uniref:phage tail tape measure protein n=1 Tax=Haemophilus influenzae TaxID=727 RepID=UPI00058920EB|nr:phage tail tape measure protein [Haemophilus influenzae]AJO90319.1 phage tail tape measure protein, TP901 family, core region [Haemophilus influenzae]AJO91327.1 phage tail tape measure protein, TP901 family, core region [Haemophilus influenzae]KIG23507.1 phage tail length tape measure protein [Haemophilus influenzae 60294N1]KPH68913.1 phage tail tape measure protein [Haemophilus influenzae]MCK8822631.1 phage tail tape measure protein [Haemophilus influenzae]
MAELNLALKLKAQDQASRVFRRAQSQITQSTRAMAQARERLGVRSEHKIQQEINHTIAAYNRLKRSGTATSRELARAAEATRSKIAGLNAEMGKTSWGQRLGNVGTAIASVGAGMAAGAMVMAQPMKKEMDYDRRLAMVSNTAFSDRDVAGRIAGKKELHDAVKSAVETGGGTKEEALGALDKLLASGTVKAETAMKLLPTLQKGAVATGASTEDLSAIAISAMQQFGIREDQIGAVLDKAVAAGQAGNFELSDMARWLPQQMAAAKSAGLSGMDGFEALLVANQQARVTAGTSDEAGNNLVNLLAKLTSKETADRFSKLEIKGKDGKTHGIDFIKSMENEKKQGKNSIEAFGSIMDMVVGEDKRYQALKAKLKTAKKEEQQALIEQMTNLVEGTAIGQIISDRQALMALLGIRNNVELGKQVKEEVTNSEGATDKSHKVVMSTNSAKVEQAKNAVEFAQMEGMKSFNNALGDAATKLAEYAKVYPNLTSTLTTAGTVITALSTAAIAASGALALLGVKRGGIGLSDVADVAGNLGKGKNGLKIKGGGKLGSILSAGALFTSGLMIAGEQRTTEEAKAEEKAEAKTAQEKQLENQFYANAYGGNKPTTTHYAPQGFGYNKNSVWGTAGRSGEVAEIARKDEVATLRLERGTLTQAQYDERTRQSAVKIAEIRNQGKGYSGLSVAANDTDSALSRTLGDLSSLANYQADFQHFGQTISDGLKTAIESQNFTIQNEIKVDLDGRIVAEQTSQYQYQDLKRG